MSDRNSWDYLDLDNFDEGIDSRDYRRRYPDRKRNSSYGVRPTYDRRPRSRRRRRNRRRTRNRIIMVTVPLLILVLLITLIAAIVNGCNNRTEPTVISTDTKPPVAATEAPSVPSTTVPATQPVNSGDKLSITNFIAPQPSDNHSAGYESGAIYVWNGAGYELFGADEESGRYYAETVNNLADKLSGMNVYSMIVPNHTEMGLPARFSSEVYTASQANNIKAAYAAMDTTKVKPINAYNYLSEHCNEYIYFKSDHHWTGLGAYYAYAAFADTLGIPKLPLENCTEQTIEGFTGSFSNMAQLETDTVHYWQFPYAATMDITEDDGNQVQFESPYYEAEESGPNSYGVFIFGDNAITVLRSSSSDAQKGKRIAVIKESYGNAFVPYLTNNYEEVHVLDMRSFRKASSDNFVTYCQNNKITDVLFLNGVMSANAQTLLDSMTAMFN